MLEKHENKKLFEMNFVRILRFYTYSNNLQSL